MSVLLLRRANLHRRVRLAPTKNGPQHAGARRGQGADRSYHRTRSSRTIGNQRRSGIRICESVCFWEKPFSSSSSCGATTGLSGPDAEHRVDTIINNSRTAIARARAALVTLAFFVATALLLEQRRPGREPKPEAGIVTGCHHPTGGSMRTASTGRAHGSGRQRRPCRDEPGRLVFAASGRWPGVIWRRTWLARCSRTMNG